MIKVLFFAQLAELAEGESINLPFQAGSCVRDYLAMLSDKIPEPAVEALQDDAIMISINKQFATIDEQLNDGDEVGLLPPFSGG